VAVLSLRKALCSPLIIGLAGFVVRTLRAVPIPPVVFDGVIKASFIVKTKSISNAWFVNRIGQHGNSLESFLLRFLAGFG
jgi:hypothetical protein